MTRSIDITDDPSELSDDDQWRWLELALGGLPSPPRDAEGRYDQEAFFQWVAAGFSIVLVDRALRQGRPQADGLRDAAEFLLKKDGALARGVRPYLSQTEPLVQPPEAA